MAKKNVNITTGVHHIKHLGDVVITGTINAVCALFPKPRTLILDVNFHYADAPLAPCSKELWESFEDDLKEALHAFWKVEKEMLNSVPDDAI